MHVAIRTKNRKSPQSDDKLPAIHPPHQGYGPVWAQRHGQFRLSIAAQSLVEVIRCLHLSIIDD